jgi:hypothetical protein
MSKLCSLTYSKSPHTEANIGVGFPHNEYYDTFDEAIQRAYQLSIDPEITVVEVYSSGRKFLRMNRETREMIHGPFPHYRGKYPFRLACQHVDAGGHVEILRYETEAEMDTFFRQLKFSDFVCVETYSLSIPFVGPICYRRFTSERPGVITVTYSSNGAGTFTQNVATTVMNEMDEFELLSLDR